MSNAANALTNKKVGRPTKREERIKHKLENAKPMERGSNLGLDSTKKLDGMVYRWFNDKGGRIQRAQAAGWEFVTNAGELVENPETAEELEARKSKRVGTDESGNALQAYLMAVEEEVFDAMRAKSQSRNDQIMEQIENRPAVDGDVNPEHVYKKGVQDGVADISVSKGKPLRSM